MYNDNIYLSLSKKVSICIMYIHISHYMLYIVSYNTIYTFMYNEKYIFMYKEMFVVIIYSLI